MSRGLRFASTAQMPDSMRSLAERALQAAPSPAPRPPKSRKALVSEHVEAVRLMQLVRSHEADCPELQLFYAIPNGGDRHKATAGKMRAEGQRPGAPDYGLPVARHGFHGLYLELKSMTGAASDEQRRWIERLRAEGYRAEVVRGHRAAWDLLRDYLGLDA